MAVAQVNGNVERSAPNSAFIQHLLDYPLISDSVTTVSDTVQRSPYAQRSLRLGDSAYRALAAPVMPYVAGPYSRWLSPYVHRADSLGDHALARVDERFPVVRRPTAELARDVRRILFLPYQKGLEGRDHVLRVYEEETKKQQEQQQQQGQGQEKDKQQAAAAAAARHYNYIVGHGKAAIATLFYVSNETLALASSYVSNKKAQVTEEAKEKTN